MKIITKSDFNLISDLSSRDYSDNSMSTNSSEQERLDFRNFKQKLKSIAEDYKNQYNSDFGVFTSGASSGNPIKFNGTRLNRVWSGIFKGADNKQYSAQISFVIDEIRKCIDVGFYFGRASSRGKSTDKDRLIYLGKTLSESILSNKELTDKFEKLIDFGFQTYSSNKKVGGLEWLQIIKTNPENSQIIYKLAPNEDGYIETSTLNLYVSMLMFLMSLIPSVGTNTTNRTVKPMTPEQRAKQAERRALIGAKGEEFVFNKEKMRFESFGIDFKNYLEHVALVSDNYGYDIKSCDEKRNEIFIEVKTTTRTKDDYGANSFHMSSNEYDFYKKNKGKYRLVRVYDIEGENPISETIDLNSVKISNESYLIEIITAHNNVYSA